MPGLAGRLIQNTSQHNGAQLIHAKFTQGVDCDAA